jgi:ComF family protein
MAGTLRRELLSLLVPPLCAACREPEFSGTALCPECRSRLVPLAAPRCRRCGAPVVRSTASCRECGGRKLHFVRAWAPFAYEGVARTLVGALKSRGLLAVAGLMAVEMAARAPTNLLRGMLVPVPAHPRRRRAQGFNHAHAIARALGRRCSLTVSDVLERRAATPQAGLERRSRLANARGSVGLRRGAQAPRTALLIDDVYTTGATVDACAQALSAAGTETLLALTFARAVRG